MGAKLFIRGRGMKDLRLTEAGENFLPLARRWRTLLPETDDFAAAKRQEYLHLAAVYTANRYILPPVYQRFLEREMPTALWVETMRAPDAISAVTQGVCDLAIVDMLPDHDQRLDVRLLFRESFIVLTILCLTGMGGAILGLTGPIIAVLALTSGFTAFGALAQWCSYL